MGKKVNELNIFIRLGSQKLLLAKAFDSLFLCTGILKDILQRILAAGVAPHHIGIAALRLFYSTVYHLVGNGVRE